MYGRSIEKRLILNQMRWAGRVDRMEIEGFQNNSFIVSKLEGKIHSVNQGNGLRIS